MGSRPKCAGTDRMSLRNVLCVNDSMHYREIKVLGTHTRADF